MTCHACHERPAVAKGLCLRCYKRARRGSPELKQHGQPDGHGHFGVLDEAEGGLLCHECGRRYRSLGSHVARVHDITAVEYRRKHGLPAGRGLVVSEISQRASEFARGRIDSPDWKRFVAVRDPEAAARAREFPGHSWAPTVNAARAENAARVGQESRSAAVRTCPGCGAQWCPLPGGYRVRTCGAHACRAAGRAEALRARAAARPRLDDDQRARLLALVGQDEALVTEVRRLAELGVVMRDVAATLGVSPSGVSRIQHGTVPASLRR